MTAPIGKMRVLSGLFWKLLERGGTQGALFIIQILLARLLSPKDYGLIVITTIFITISNVIIQNGFSIALIQKKVVDELDFNSVFYMSLFISLLLYILSFLISPYIARFYEQPELTIVLRVLALTLFSGAINSIPQAVAIRNLQFKKLFISSLGAVVISGIVGVTLAFHGFGVWALVIQQLANQMILAIILWFIIRWRPRITFSYKRIGVLFSFGWKLLLSSLIETMYRNLNSLIIGKIFEPAVLGYYDRGQQFPSVVVSYIDGSIQSVMLPVLASQQDYLNKIKEMVRRSIVTSSFVIFPMMVGLGVIADGFVRIVLTEKWIDSVPFIQIFCAIYAFFPIHTANLQAINALGRSDIFLKLEIWKKIIGFTLLFVSISFGVYAIALGQLISGLIATFINSYPNKKLLNYSYIEQIRDIVPSLMLSLVMGCLVYLVNLFGLGLFPTLALQLIIGCISYISMAYIFRLECFMYLINTFREILIKVNKQ